MAGEITMKDYLLAKLERSLIDLRRASKPREIKQLKAHIRNTRNKLRAMHEGKAAWEMERKYR